MCTWSIRLAYTMLCLAMLLGQAALIRSSCQSTYGTKKIAIAARADGFSNISAICPVESVLYCAVLPGLCRDHRSCHEMSQKLPHPLKWQTITYAKLYEKLTWWRWWWQGRGLHMHHCMPWYLKRLLLLCLTTSHLLHQSLSGAGKLPTSSTVKHARLSFKSKSAAVQQCQCQEELIPIGI